jgi:hypothetical protein
MMQPCNTERTSRGDVGRHTRGPQRWLTTERCLSLHASFYFAGVGTVVATSARLRRRCADDRCICKHEREPADIGGAKRLELQKIDEMNAIAEKVRQAEREREPVIRSFFAESPRIRLFEDD